MRKLFLDFETFSEAKLKEIGPWEYSLHPSTKVLCCAWSPGGDQVILFKGKDIYEKKEFHKCITRYYADEDYLLYAWNVFFEYCIWHNTLKWDPMPPKKWRDPSAQAVACSLPSSLSDCGAALKLDQDKQKDKRGVYLINRLSKPHVKNDDLELLEEMYIYCKQDVISMREIEKKIPKLSDFEQKVWETDLAINLRGIPIDRENCKNAIEILDQSMSPLNEEISEYTKGKITTVNQTARIIIYAKEEFNFYMTCCDKEYLEKLMELPELPKGLKKLIEFRRRGGKTSTKRFQTMLDSSKHDERTKGNFWYCGASRTGRWSGSLIQPHNIPRGDYSSSLSELENCVSSLKYRDYELMKTLFGDVSEALKNCLRPMIKAPKRKTFIIFDYASIEARILAWLARQEESLKIFKGDGKFYEHTASKIYNVPVNQVTKKQRTMGKVATLALGYQGGIGALSTWTDIFKIEMSDEKKKGFIKDWRNANSKIVALWYNIDDAAKSAIREKNRVFEINGLEFISTDSVLSCKLPSGRFLRWWYPKIENSKIFPGLDEIVFEDFDKTWKVELNKPWKWKSAYTYGGKITENIIQGIARDILAQALVKAEKLGLIPIMHVHDEIVLEVSENTPESLMTSIKKIMCDLPPWGETIPMDATGFATKRYRKG